MLALALAPPGQTPPAPPARVWLVEDEPSYRETLGVLLSHVDGIEHDGTFGDAEAVLAAAEGAQAGARPRPDLVLMDVNLPGIDGVAATSRLRALVPTARVVVLTIRDDAETLFEALQAGASGYLLKDAPIDALVAALREALGGAMLVPAPVARKMLGFFRAAPTATEYGLTDRERDVLRHMADGLTQKEIAGALYISPATVNGHVQRVYEKLRVHTAPGAVAKALRERLF